MLNKINNPTIPPYLGSLVPWATNVVNALLVAFNAITQRLNMVLPEDGSEAMTGAMRLVVLTFATLPSAPARGMICYISDSTTNTWGANVTVGGGANAVFVGYNGTNWTVIGK